MSDACRVLDGDTIDDVAVLRAGAAASSVDGTQALSTGGPWLPAHEKSDVRQLDAVGATWRGRSGATCD